MRINQALKKPSTSFLNSRIKTSTQVPKQGQKSLKTNSELLMSLRTNLIIREMLRKKVYTFLSDPWPHKIKSIPSFLGAKLCLFWKTEWETCITFFVPFCFWHFPLSIMFIAPGLILFSSWRTHYQLKRNYSGAAACSISMERDFTWDHFLDLAHH